MTTNQQLYDFSKKYSNRRLSPLKSIKAYCRDQCCVSDLESWKNCTFTGCLLYRYRLGVGNKSRKAKDEQKQALTLSNQAREQPSGEGQEVSNE